MKTDTQKHIRNVSYIIYTLAGIGVIYVIFKKMLPVVMPFILAGVFAVILAPGAEKLEKRLKMPKSASALIILLLAFGAVIAVVIIIGSYVYKIAEEIIFSLMQGGSFEGLNYFSEKLKGIFGLNINLSESFKNFITPFATMLVDILKPIALGAPGAFISMIVFVLSSYFFIADREIIKKFLDKITGKRFCLLREEIKKAAKESLVKYFKAQSLIMVITFLTLFIGFTIMKFTGILDFSYMFITVALIALLDALPLFGTGAVLIPWSIYGVIAGKFYLGASMFAVYVACMIIRQTAEPKILGDSFGIHPVISLFALFLGMKTMGIAGMILLPLAVVIILQLFRKESLKNLIFTGKNKERQNSL